MFLSRVHPGGIWAKLVNDDSCTVRRNRIAYYISMLNSDYSLVRNLPSGSSRRESSSFLPPIPTSQFSISLSRTHHFSYRIFIYSTFIFIRLTSNIIHNSFSVCLTSPTSTDTLNCCIIMIFFKFHQIVPSYKKKKKKKDERDDGEWDANRVPGSAILPPCMRCARQTSFTSRGDEKKLNK